MGALAETLRSMNSQRFAGSPYKPARATTLSKFEETALRCLPGTDAISTRANETPRTTSMERGISLRESSARAIPARLHHFGVRVIFRTHYLLCQIHSVRRRAVPTFGSFDIKSRSII